MGYRIAVAGATGAVGSEILNILDEVEFPAEDVVALASPSSVGKEISFGDDERLKVKDLSTFDFTGIDIALFSPGASVSSVHAPRAAEAGCVVVDNTSYFRMEPDVPLIVPEVNREALAGFRNRNIIANPNCSTIQMVMALKPLHDLAAIKRVVVSTYQATGGAGQKGMDELFEQTKSIFMNDKKAPSIFTKQIAFNCIPFIDKLMDDGSSKEEWKMNVETKKILDASIDVAATCVRVPVFVGHAEAVNVEFHEPIDIDEAREALQNFDGIVVVDDPADHQYVTHVDCVGEFATFVSRLRVDESVAFGLNMWVVSDNLRKGAALNTVQIAQALIDDGYL